MAEFKIRGLVRRLDKNEVELRELKAGGGFYDDEERQVRTRALRRWIKQDEAQLRALLGANNQIAAPEIKGNQPAQAQKRARHGPRGG